MIPVVFCHGSLYSQSIVAWDGESQTVLLRDLEAGKPGVFKQTPESSWGTSEISLVRDSRIFCCLRFYDYFRTLLVDFFQNSA